jgi:methionine-rich copper-binding protein CopC
MPSRRRRTPIATLLDTAVAAGFRGVAVAALVGVGASLGAASTPASASLPASASGWASGSASGRASGSAEAHRALPLHTRIVSSTPADGSTVDVASEVVLMFSESVNPDFVAVTVEGPGGDEAAGEAVARGREVTQALSKGLAAGEHVVTFRVVSSDGHPVSGTVRFETTQAAAVSPSPPSSTTPSSSSPSAPAATQSPASGGSAPASDPAAEASAMPSWLLVALGVAVLAGLAGAVLWASRRGNDAEVKDAPTLGP